MNNNLDAQDYIEWTDDGGKEQRTEGGEEGEEDSHCNS
jgi:hypothetical protein